MGAHYVINPSQETDLLRYMKRPDLYQFADLHDVDYPKDAPAEIMKQLLRASGRIPEASDFNVKADPKTGQVLSVSYKRKSAAEAPRSKHAEADEAKTAKHLAQRREELENMNNRQLERLVRDQFGKKAIESDPTREDMIALFVGEKSENKADPFASSEELLEESKVHDASNTNSGIPDWLLDSLSPPALVKVCRRLGLEASIKDGKKALLEKVRGHAA